MGSIKFNTNRTKIDLTGVTETESSTLSGKGKQTAVLPTYKPNFKDVNLTTIQAQARTPIFKSVTTPRKYTTPTKKPKIELPKYTPFTNEEVGLLQHQTRLPMALPKSDLTSKAATNTEYALKSNPTAYGFMEGFSPLATKNQLSKQLGQEIDTTGAEDTLGYKVGYGAGLMGQYLSTGGIAHAGVRQGLTRAIPSLVQNASRSTAKNVLGVMGASALADVLTGVPINTVQAIKESTVGEEVNWNQFAKSFAVNTAIDVVFGGLIEGGLVLKSGKKIKTVGDLKTVTLDESQEITEQLMLNSPKYKENLMLNAPTNKLLNIPQKQLTHPVNYVDELGNISNEPNFNSVKKVNVDNIETPKRVYAGELPKGAKLPENTLSKKIIEKKKAEPIILGGKVEEPQNIKQPTIAKRTPLKKAEQELPNLETKYVSGLKADARNQHTYVEIGEKFKAHSPELQKEIMQHENAHTLATNLYEKNKGLWIDIMDNKNFGNRKTTKDGRAYWEGIFGDVGSNSVDETFTESIAVFMRNPEWLKENHPEAYNFIKNILKENQTFKGTHTKLQPKIPTKVSKAEPKADTAKPEGLFVDYYPEKRAVDVTKSNDYHQITKEADYKPDDSITVYRGAIDTQSKIVDGDWVTTSKQLAKDYAGTGKVIEDKIAAKYLYASKGEGIEELIYSTKGTKIPTKFKSVEAELKSLTAEMKVTPPTETQIKRYKQLKAQVKPAKIPTREPVSTVEPVKAAKPTLTPKTEKNIPNAVKTDNPYLNTITNVTEKTKAEKRLGENITFVNNKGNLTKATRKEYIEDMAMIDGSQIKTTQKLRTNGGKTFEVNEYRVYKTPNSKEPIKISKYEKDYFDFAKKNQDNVVQSVTQSDKSVQEVMKGLPEDIKAEYSMFENGFEGTAGNGIGLGKFVDKASDSHVGRSNDIERNAEYTWGKDTEAHKTWTEKFSKPFAESKRRNVDGFDSEMKGMGKVVIEDLKIKKNSPESAAVQWIGEGKRVIKEGKGLRKSLKEVDYTLDELKKDFNYVTSNGKKAWENIVEADTYFRSRYNRYVGEINEALKKIYPNVEKEVAKIEAKIAKLTDPTEITKLQARIKKETDPVKLKALESKLKNLKDPKYIENKIGDYRWEINQATNNKRLYPQKNYYRHIKEMKDSLFTNIDNIKHSATDLEPATKPNSKFSSILQSRKHGLDYKADAISGFEDYILQAEYKINIEPNIPTLRGIVKELRAASGETGNAKRFITSVEDLANELAGKSNPIDKIPNLLLMSEDRGKAFTKITTKIMNRIKANAVLGNVGTMIVQPANFNNVVAYAKNPLDVADGMILATKALAGDKNAKAILAKSTALAERYMRRDLRRIDTGAVKKLENTTVWLLEALDKAVADSAFITFYKQGIKKGLKESDAIFQADKLVKKSIGGRGIGEMPISQNAQLTKNLVPFTVEVRNAVNVYKEMLFDMTKGVKTGDKALMASGALGLTEIMAVSYLMNEMYEKVLGRRITIDYIDSTKEALSGEDKTPQEKMVDLMYSTLGETLSGLPAGQYIAGLAQSATDLDSYELKAMFGDADPTRFGTGAMLATTFGKPIAQAIRGQKVDVITPALSVLPKFGGRQIDRTLEGAKNMGLLPNNGKMQDFPASYSATDKLRFTLDKTPENYVKALTTGIWSTDEGKNYIKQERVPLGSNQQAAVVSLGGTTESEEFVRSFPKTGVDAQREAIFNSNFTPAQKVMLDRTLIDSPVETQYRTKTDYEFSLLSDTKKQKYLPVAAANLKINKRVYMDMLSNVDLNKNGTIKQDEAKAYLDGITSLTKEQKAVLWKSVNSGWSTKNNPYL